MTNPEDGGLYYAWDVGNGWRAYAMNTEIDTSGAQLTWLKADVAAHPADHYLLYTHHPRFTSGTNTARPRPCARCGTRSPRPGNWNTCCPGTTTSTSGSNR